MAYLAYHFVVRPAQPGTDILIAYLSEFAFESFETNENGFVAYLNEGEHGRPDLGELSFQDFSYTCEIISIDTVNWNQEWEKNFEPVLIDDLICIRAPFHPENKQVKMEIVIMPKMSFGTGHHQTTRLMCRAMFERNFKNKRVLDMGCGTGVLAILAKKLGATDVLGIDIDEWSVENSIENCEGNVGKAIRILKGDVKLLEKEKPFDFIIANINKNVLKHDLKFYTNKLSKKGLLFLSGFFTTDVPELKAVAGLLGLKLIHTAQENEWAMMLLEN